MCVTKHKVKVLIQVQLLFALIGFNRNQIWKTACPALLILFVCCPSNMKLSCPLTEINQLETSLPSLLWNFDKELAFFIFYSCSILCDIFNINVFSVYQFPGIM